MKNKKFAIYLGKGIEGCGVTAFAKELADYFDKHSIYYDVYAYADKTFVRKNAHVFRKPVIVHNKKNSIESILSDFRKYDAVLVQSLPSKSSSEDAINTLTDVFKQTDVDLFYFHHNHSKMFYSKEVMIDDVLLKAKKVFVHSLSNPLVQKAKSGKLLPVLKKLELFSPGSDVKGLREKFWKNINEKNLTPGSTVYWLGRTTPLKGYDLMMSIHDVIKGNFKTELHGMDKGPAFIGFKENHKGKYLTGTSEETKSNTDNLALVFEPYVRDEMLEKVSVSPFTFQLTKFKEDDFNESTSFEFTHVEIPAIGSIPVFRKDFGQLCYSRVHGVPAIEVEDSGIIWVDENNIDEVHEQMLCLMNDKVAYEAQREKAYQFMLLQSDSDVIYDDIMKSISSDESRLTPDHHRTLNASAVVENTTKSASKKKSEVSTSSLGDFL